MEIKSYKEFVQLLEADKISGPIAIYGDEKHLVKRSVETILSRFRDYSDLNITILDGESANYQNVLNACETMPFLSERRLVLVKNSNLFGKSGGSNDTTAKLSEYVKSVPNSVLLVFLFEEAENSNPVIKVIKQLGYMVEYKFLKGEELYNEVLQLFDRNGKSITKADIAYLISETGSSIETLEKEVEKLCSYAIDSENISREHIDEIVVKNPDSNVFKMVDSISKRDAEHAFSILNTLLEQDEDCLKIMGMIIRQYRMLYLVMCGINKKKTAQEMESSLKIRSFALQNFMKQCRNIDRRKVVKALNCCLNTDFEIKSGRLNPRMAIELLIVELCK